MAFSVSPSSEWLGNDGPWSTFKLLVGTPAQQFDVLPATSLQFTVVVAERGCTREDPSDCADLRGQLFNSSKLYETGWQGINSSPDEFSTLVFPAAQATLPKEVNAEMGTTTLGLDWSDSGINQAFLQDQVIAGIAAKEPFLGLLGLSGWSLTSIGDSPYDTPLLALRNRSTVSSRSWGYTAGVKYNDHPEVLGSLTFGGYDASRVNMGTALTELPLKQAWGEELAVAIKLITWANSTYNYSQSVDIKAALDSMVPDIWLPDDICDMFEHHFGLDWNDTAKMYLIDDTQHERLKSQNLSVSFDLTSGVNETGHITIHLPYSAFDHVAKFPLAGINDSTTTSRYFPLKRSGNNPVHFLGRTFFQEAYVAAEYDRGVFRIGQAILNPSDPPNVVAFNPGEEEGTLGTAAIAGIAVGGVALLSILAVLIWWRHRSRKRRLLTKPTPRIHRVLSADETTLTAADVEMTSMAVEQNMMTEHYKPGAHELYGGLSDGAAEPYSKPELDATTTATRHELASANSTAQRPAHRRQQQSFGSSQSGISPMGIGDRASGLFGEPSPPLNYSPRPSPPLPDRRHGATSPFAPFELP